MARIRNMGTATMRFNEGVIVSGSAGSDPDYTMIVSGSQIIEDKLCVGGGVAQGIVHVEVPNGAGDIVFGSNKAVISANDGLGNFFFVGTLDGTNYRQAASFHAKASQNWNSSTNTYPADFQIKTSNGNSLAPRITVKDSGNVGIGTESPNEKLSVEGVISLKEQSGSPSDNTGYGKLYVNGSDSSLYFRDESGNQFNLISANGVWEADGSDIVKLADNNDKVGIGTSSPDTKLEIEHTGEPQQDLSDRSKYHLLLSHVMGNHDTSYDKSIGIGFNVRSAFDADEIGAAIVHVQSGSDDVGNLSFYIKGKTADQADPTLVLVMSASQDDRGGRVSINSPVHHQDVIKWPLEVTNYAAGASAGGKTCLRLTAELDDTGVTNFGSGARMRFAVRQTGDETRDLAAVSAIQDTATTAGKLQLATTNMGSSDPTTKMTISQEGFVGIGLEDPDTPLHVQSTSGSPGGLLRLKSIFSNYWDIFIGNPNGNTLYFKYNGADNGGYLSADADVENINFTGQHRASPVIGVADDYKDKIGMIVVSSGEYNNLSGTDKKPGISESVPSVLMSSQKNQKSVFGVVADVELKSENERKFEQGAFVTTFNKPNDDERLIINSIGEGAVWVCNLNGNLENGDYITTCELSGLGTKQDDDLLHNYTVAKITQDCNFDTESSSYDTIEFLHNGITYKKSFVGCTYHCG